MSILVKGMRMPKNEELIIICSDGTVEMTNNDGCRVYEQKAIELSPHGRLIDADALHIDLIDRGIADIQTSDWYEIRQAVDDAPTIIEAEGEE